MSDTTFIAFQTLIKREIKRFMKVIIQTVAISSALLSKAKALPMC